MSSDVATSAEQRVVDTLIGAALVLLASAITVLWARQQHNPDRASSCRGWPPSSTGNALTVPGSPTGRPTR